MYDYDFSKRDVKLAAGTPSPEAQARDQATVLLEQLNKDPQFDGWTSGMLERVDDSNARVAKFRAELAGVLRQLAEDPWKISSERVLQALRDASFVFTGRVESLHVELENWADKLKADVEEVNRIRRNVATLLELGPKYNEWNQIVVKKKGTTALGTSLKFTISEATRRNTIWVVYITEVKGVTYRIAPPTPGDRIWMLDKKGITWEVLDGQTYSKPTDAAKALEQKLQITREV
jgi:hypothetical protein